MLVGERMVGSQATLPHPSDEGEEEGKGPPSFCAIEEATVSSKDSAFLVFSRRVKKLNRRLAVKAHWDMLGSIDFTTIEVWTKDCLVTPTYSSLWNVPHGAFTSPVAHRIPTRPG